MQVTRWTCGSVVLGLSAFHCLMDAQAAATFMSEWGRQCAGFKVGSAPIPLMAHQPTFDRTFLSAGMEAALSERPVHDNVFRIFASPPAAPAPPAIGWTAPHVVTRAYHFPRSELEALRSAATATEETKVISAYDALFAHMIAVIGAATDTVGEEPVMVCQIINARKLFGQPHFFGSCAFWLHHRTTYAAIQASLPATAAAINHTHASADRTAILAYNAYAASAPSTAHVQLQARITTHDFHVTSWRNCGMYDVDFGWGRPALMAPGQLSNTRYMILGDGAKGSAGEGGVDVWLALEDEHWQRMVEQGRLHRYAPPASDAEREK